MRNLTTDQMLAGEQLRDDELDSLSTARLFNLFKKIRALAEPKGWGLWHRCCDICYEWIGTAKQYEEEVEKPSRIFQAYADRLKEKLRLREDQFSHRKRLTPPWYKRRKKKLAMKKTRRRKNRKQRSI